MLICFIFIFCKSEVIKLQLFISRQWTPLNPNFSLCLDWALSPTFSQDDAQGCPPCTFFHLHLFWSNDFSISFSLLEKISLEVHLWTDVFQRILCHASLFNSQMQSFEQENVD